MRYIVQLILFFTVPISFAISVMEGLTHGHEAQEEWWDTATRMQVLALLLVSFFVVRDLLKSEATNDQ
jgi:hypothetical protein